MYAASALASSTAPKERRFSQRYPITAIAELRVLGSEKRARAVIHNISSHGVFFSAKVVLDARAPVRLLIDWLVRLDGRIPLALVLEGMVIRSDLAGTALRIGRHKWRIRARTIEPRAE